MPLVATNGPEAMRAAYGKLEEPQVIPNLTFNSSVDMINWVGTGKIDRENIMRLCRLLRHHSIDPATVYVSTR